MEHPQYRRSALAAALVGIVGALLLALPADAAARPKASVAVADTAAIAPDGSAVIIEVTASCARRWTVLEAFVTVSQPQVSGMGGIPLSCTGRVQTFAVTVPALDAAFTPGDAQASAFILIERRGRTQQAQDTAVVTLTAGN
jgi:hypothetical protein